MRRLRLFCLLALFAGVGVNAQNISVKSFQLLETDLTALFRETQEIDQNGEVAALIKVITTETGFLFDVGALGIVKRVQKPGEIWLYVPHGVQRININHQELGRLEKPYYFPIPIQAARTYELVLTANRVKNNVEEEKVVQVVVERTQEEQDKELPLSPVKERKPSFFHKTGFYVDAHFLLGAPYAAGTSMGTYLNGFNLEGSIDFAIGAGTEVAWYQLVDGIYEPFMMTYVPSPLISGCVGYGISIGERLRLTPRVGTGVLTITGKSIAERQKTFILSGTASLRVEYAFSRRLGFYMTPTYNLPLKRGDTAKQLKGDVEAFSKWNSGFSARIGISVFL